MLKTFEAKSQPYLVTISKGNVIRTLDKEKFEAYLYDLMDNVMDVDRLEELRNYYLNSFEWIFLNLFRCAGIQLYDDGEIRINILPSKIEQGKKCIFLRESELEDRNLDSILYEELERMVIHGL